MADLLRAAGTSQNAFAIVETDEFARAGGSVFPTLCEERNGLVRVKISPAAYDYLNRLNREEQDKRIVAAVRIAAANSRPRLWSTDFALVDGARTEEEVAAWHERHGITVRSATFGSLVVPGNSEPVGVVHAPARDMRRSTARPVASPSVVALVEPQTRSTVPVPVTQSDQRELRQREQELRDEFVLHLKRLGVECRTAIHNLEDGRQRLENDLYIPEKRQLIEAKADSSRPHVRMAIGQLLDYAYYMADRGGLEVLELAVLLPRRPAEIEHLLDHLEIACIWRTEDGDFDDNRGGRFTT